MAGLTDDTFHGEGRTKRLDAILTNHGVLECAAALETLATEGTETAHLVLAAANRIVDLERQIWYRIQCVQRMSAVYSERVADLTSDHDSTTGLLGDAYEYEQMALRHSEARRAFRTIAKLWRQMSVTDVQPSLADMVRDIATHPLVQAVKDHAREHYEDGGWDVVVEAWTDVEIAKRIVQAKATTAEEAIAAFNPMVDVWADRQADARNSAF